MFTILIGQTSPLYANTGQETVLAGANMKVDLPNGKTFPFFGQYYQSLYVSMSSAASPNKGCLLYHSN